MLSCVKILPRGLMFNVKRFDYEDFISFGYDVMTYTITNFIQLISWNLLNIFLLLNFFPLPLERKLPYNRNVISNHITKDIRNLISLKM